MRRLFSALSLTRGGRRRRSPRANDRSHQTEEARGATSDSQSSGSAIAGGFERVNKIAMGPENSLARNIILNHDFSGGLHSWHPNGCHAYVVSRGPHASNNLDLKSRQCYAVVTKRTECWQGLEQDITEKVSPGSTYALSACVKVSGGLEEFIAVQATLKLENPDSPTGYLSVGRTSLLKEQWGNVEGTFSLSSKPRRVVLYLEGPPPGVDLLISYVVVFPSSDRQFDLTEQTELGPPNIIRCNIIQNHDFSEGLLSWHPNSCEAYVVRPGTPNSIASKSEQCYAVVTKRTESWQGLEQDITGQVSPGSTYAVSAFVRVWGALEGSTAVQATLKLDYSDSPTRYISVGRVSATKEQWEKLEGNFSLPSMPKHVVFYLEGPPSGVDLLIKSVVGFPYSQARLHDAMTKFTIHEDENIVQNPNFDNDLVNWSGRGCKIRLHGSMENGSLLPVSGKAFASATERTQIWNGIQQEITGRVQRKLAYEISAAVRIRGHITNANVQATLWVQSPNGREHYIGIAKVQALDNEWVQLQGKFLLNNHPSKAVIYLEGPPPGTDILVDNFMVKRAKKHPPSPPPEFGISTRSIIEPRRKLSTNIILNPDFSDGLHSWHPNSCSGHVASGSPAFVEGITPNSGESYAVVSNRTDAWQGLEQDITERVMPNSSYKVSAWVRVCSEVLKTYEVQATIKLQHFDSNESYLPIGRVVASKEQWVELTGSFSLLHLTERIIFFLEGPPPGVNLLVDSVTIVPVISTEPKSIVYGDNIVENSNLTEELNSWHPMGPCFLMVGSGSPRLLPSAAKESLKYHKPLSGHYIHATNRTETWMGPAQNVTDRIMLHLTYQVSAWARIGSRANSPQTINIALDVDSSWVNVSQIEVNDGGWHELAGSFKLEKQPRKVIVYVQGPSPGVDLMIAGLQIFPVDRITRFKHLKRQTDNVRKRNVVLKFSGSHTKLFGAVVKIRQVQNSFPFGSCISRSNLDNEEFVEFFLNNFNWAVFGNELKWYHTEPQRGNFNYSDADEMLNFCERHGIKTRGHCIFWEVEDAVQPWVRSLRQDDLKKAIYSRLTSLLSRYKGRFRHHDVNNEMLHGSFYQGRLGKDIWLSMFKVAKQIDPSAMLFVNDYHVEDGTDARSSPEKYVQQILDLHEQGAHVGGIGIQGHIEHPVGPIICAALDKLAILGLPIWFTELDVSAVNEHVRADDLEVVLREAYAHPAVEGIMLWGFWETFMCRDHSHLVDAEGDINEAGKRFLALKKEWLTNADGSIDGHKEFRFRGFPGTYDLEITTPSEAIHRKFDVEKGEHPLVLDIHI